ncbi:electron transfer flavoprotein subunit alpha/FixB family protein [Hyphomicrobium sp.]|jgi:electron transfer flavoprotein alpha subunit|uniref:electron transfer flavoprotein subunit alpha/FixB family protein n=1 Tax=Hyphomicrobium sp. TaxID=82 RepID=UPI003562501F
MSGVKRIDPRRPYRITPLGLRRIVLGEIEPGDVVSRDARPVEASAVKPLRTDVAASGWHMAVAHSYCGRLDDHAREAIAAAAILARRETGVIAVILGPFHEDAAALGADRIVVFNDLDAARFQPQREEALLSALIDDYAPEHVFMPDNALGDGDLGRRLIAKLGCSAATHVSEIDARHVGLGWSGGASLAHAPLPRVVLLQQGVVDSNLPFVGIGEHIAGREAIEAVEVCRDLGLEPTESASIALEEADFIVSAGNGVSNVATLEDLAASLGAAVGASRVAVDDGKFPRSKQIGASGKTVSATTYFAVGISGAVQHLQGIKACRHVIAINRDPGAPIVKRADLTVIGDAEDLMRALIARIAQARDQSEASESER